MRLLGLPFTFVTGGDAVQQLGSTGHTKLLGFACEVTVVIMRSLSANNTEAYLNNTAVIPICSARPIRIHGEVNMPAVDPIKLKRLMTLEMLLPFALKRRLSAGQLGDLVRRAMDDRRFDLSAHIDEFIGYMNPDEASVWATEFEQGGTAPHIFSTPGGHASESEDMFGDLPMSEVTALSCEARLRLANEVADEKRRNDKRN